MLLSNVISDSTKGARFFTLNIKYFLLQLYMTDHKFMKIHEKYFSDEMKIKYNLHDKISQDRYLYYQIKKGMYWLK